MEQIQILENNKLIAEFMCRKISDSSDNFVVSLTWKNQCVLNPSGDVYEQIAYNTSWDWLMPVVEKISEYRLAYPEQANEVCNCKIVIGLPFLFGKCVEFIKWFNENKAV